MVFMTLQIYLDILRKINEKKYIGGGPHRTGRETVEKNERRSVSSDRQVGDSSSSSQGQRQRQNEGQTEECRLFQYIV